MKNRTQPLTHQEIALAGRIVTFITAVAAGLFAAATVAKLIWWGV